MVPCGLTPRNRTMAGCTNQCQICGTRRSAVASAASRCPLSVSTICIPFFTLYYHQSTVPPFQFFLLFFVGSQATRTTQQPPLLREEVKHIAPTENFGYLRYGRGMKVNLRGEERTRDNIKEENAPWSRKPENLLPPSRQL